MTLTWTYRPARDHGLTRHERRRSLHREAGAPSWLVRRAWCAGTGAYLRTFQRFDVTGRGRLPDLPFVLVANHTSHLDAVVLLAALPARWRDRVHVLAAGETFFAHPLVARFAGSAVDALPVWRGRCGAHALTALRERLLAEPCGYILFPEGTRSRSGALGRFRAGLGHLVAGTRAAVVPCRIEGAFAAMPPGRRWPRPAPVSVTIGRPLRFDALADDRAGWDRVARAAERAVAMMMAPGNRRRVVGTSPDGE